MDQDNNNYIENNMFFNPDQPTTSMAALSLESQEVNNDPEWLPVDIHVTPPTPAPSPGGNRRHQSTRMHEMFGKVLGLAVKKEEPKQFGPFRISIMVKKMNSSEELEPPRRICPSFPPFSSPSQSYVRHSRHLLEVPPLRRGRTPPSATYIPSRREPTATITRPPADELDLLDIQNLSTETSND